MQNEHLIQALENTKSPEKLIVIGGMHGNEKSGIEAIERVVEKLKSKPGKISGNIYFVRGNLPALRMDERFVETDLNRIWDDRFIHDSGTYQGPDFNQLREIHALIEKICPDSFENCTLLDLHTFSADDGIFCIPAGNHESIELARYYGIPLIEKLSRALPETALNYYGNKGMRSVVFEGGKHNTPEATYNLEAALWLTMEFLGIVNKKDFPVVENFRKHLLKISENYPHHLELIYHHKLTDYKNYKMNRGYYNFKKIKARETVALQNKKPVQSPYGGFMLMPLYQKKGSDGFFIVQEKKHNPK
jgi:succinylglutamate desuccinylase